MRRVVRDQAGFRRRFPGADTRMYDLTTKADLNRVAGRHGCSCLRCGCVAAHAKRGSMGRASSCSRRVVSCLRATKCPPGPRGRASVPDPGHCRRSGFERRSVARCLLSRDAPMVPTRMACAWFTRDRPCPDDFQAVALAASQPKTGVERSVLKGCGEQAERPALPSATVYLFVIAFDCLGRLARRVELLPSVRAHWRKVGKRIRRRSRPCPTIRITGRAGRETAFPRTS